jgi:hypothetical protein
MSSDETNVTVEASVTPEIATYLNEWADAVGCDVADVAGDSIEQFVEGARDE